MKRRAVILVLGLAAWVSGSAIGAIGPMAAHADSSGIAIGKAHAGYTPSLTGNKPVVILAVGSGGRPGDDIMHSLSDSIHLIFLNPAKHHATIVGIPRDSWVDIPGHGTSKINAALFYGGPALMVQTIESLTGVHIDYWAITTFWGFTNMINEINGLSIDIPFQFYDPTYSRANLEPGVQRLNGVQALSMARDRDSMLEGDFARSENQGRLILAALAQFHGDYNADPGNMFTWLGRAVQHDHHRAAEPDRAACIHRLEDPREERAERGAAGQHGNDRFSVGRDPQPDVEDPHHQRREGRRHAQQAVRHPAPPRTSQVRLRYRRGGSPSRQPWA